jgi:hypothetical protein
MVMDDPAGVVVHHLEDSLDMIPVDMRDAHDIDVATRVADPTQRRRDVLPEPPLESPVHEESCVVLPGQQQTVPIR